MKTIAFFGHSQIFNISLLKEKLIETLNQVIPKGYTNLLVGCHGDFDKLALSTSLNYKRNINENIKIKVVLSSLSFLNKNKYGYSKADIFNDKNLETMIYDIEDIHYKRRITVSNEKMIDSSDLIICYVNMKSYTSGAKTAINYAIKKKKRIINLFE